jgi:hypothetical protein
VTQLAGSLQLLEVVLTILWVSKHRSEPMAVKVLLSMPIPIAQMALNVAQDVLSRRFARQRGEGPQSEAVRANRKTLSMVAIEHC